MDCLDPGRHMVLFLTNSPFDWVIILVIVLILFGGRKIPALAKDLGGGIREFRQALLNPNQTQTTQMIEHQPQPAETYTPPPAAPRKRAAAKPAARKPAKKSRARS